MTVIWAWADLGNHALQNYNIKQYWLIMSVLSVKKFNPEWKRVFVVDNITSEYIKSKKWDSLWDEIRIVDFHNTEYGDLYNIKIYSWPKLYSYGLIDDDILILDTDIVFLKEFDIPDRTKMCGQFYNYIHFTKQNSTTPQEKMTSLRNNWCKVERVFKKFEFYNICSDYIFEQSDICLVGAPIYVPRGLGKIVQQEVLEHIIECETLGGRTTFNIVKDVFFAIEEEYPIAHVGKKYAGLCCISRKGYRHGFCGSCKLNLEEGFEKPEKILGMPVFDLYIKNKDLNIN